MRGRLSILAAALVAVAVGAPEATRAGERGPAAAAPPPRPAGVVAEGTPWATPYYVVEADRPGPTVMVVGGVHGNEPAGAAAAEQIRHWSIARGRLVVLPRANATALAANQRRIPGADPDQSDLNRNFPRAADEPPRGQPARAIWDLVRRVRPDWLVDLHESIGFRRKEPKRVGNTIIHVPDPETRRRALAMIGALNRTIAEEEKKFLLLKNPAKGSLARAAAERLRARAMIVETTRTGQPLPLRVRQHRLAVHRLLSDLEMAACGADTLLPPRRPGDPVRVAVYGGAGAGASLGPLEKALRDGDGAVWTVRIGAGELRPAVLRQFDVLVAPGGSASKQAAAMGDEGRQAVRDFVCNGGGYLGVCAGAYLATSHYRWSLGLLDAAVLDTKHWRRGTGMVRVELTEAGQELFAWPKRSFDLHFANGPLLAPGDKPDLPDFRALARFRGEVAEHGAPRGVMPGTVAAACGRFGTGRVLVFSPHPEKTPGLEPLLLRALRWVAGKTPERSLAPTASGR